MKERVTMMSNFSNLWEFLKDNDIDPLIVAIVIQIIFGNNSEN